MFVLCQVSGGGGELEESEVAGVAAGVRDPPHGRLLPQHGAGAAALAARHRAGQVRRPGRGQRGLHPRRQAAAADGEPRPVLGPGVRGADARAAGPRRSGDRAAAAVPGRVLPRGAARPRHLHPAPLQRAGAERGARARLREGRGRDPGGRGGHQRQQRHPADAADQVEEYLSGLGRRSEAVHQLK